MIYTVNLHRKYVKRFCPVGSLDRGQAFAETISPGSATCVSKAITTALAQNSACGCRRSDLCLRRRKPRERIEATTRVGRDRTLTRLRGRLSGCRRVGPADINAAAEPRHTDSALPWARATLASMASNRTAPFDLGLREILVTLVDRLELAVERVAGRVRSGVANRAKDRHAKRKYTACHAAEVST
jgi:hypothetical protein